jgi:hypothetical protein
MKRPQYSLRTLLVGLAIAPPIIHWIGPAIQARFTAQNPSVTTETYSTGWNGPYEENSGCDSFESCEPPFGK